MRRFNRVMSSACLVAIVLSPSAAAAAARMYVGFQDDPSFRFRDTRQSNLNEAERAGATIIRSQVTWARVATTRPANATDPFDPAYASLADLDELVRGAQRRGMEALLTIAGTPRWANGGKGQNVAPTRMRDLTEFALALASRYSGRYPGYPYVRFYSVWNEPNLNQFLSPQFDRRGRSVAPATYAKLYRAAYAGIKAGNRSAVVAIGETSARGHDRPKPGIIQDSHSPGNFVQLVAKADRRLRFDAWAEHPYPFRPSQSPRARVRLPNVSLTQLDEFRKLVDKAFRRKNTPIWVTEYSHETRPGDPAGIPYSRQAAYARDALRIARGYSFVPMFVWFVLRDDPSDPWQSGLLDESGNRKPAFAAFSAMARLLDARNGIVYLKAGRTSPQVRVSALEFAGLSGPSVRVGVTYKVIFRGRVVAVGQPELRLPVDGWLRVNIARFQPRAGRSYTMTVAANDENGNKINRTLTLVSVRSTARR